MDEDNKKLLLEEFKEAGHLHRLHVSLMFGQITVFLGATGGLVHRITNAPPLDPVMIRVLAIFGCLLAFLFLVLHERVYAYSHGSRSRAEEIQRILGFSVYKHYQTHLNWLQSFSASTLTRLFYIPSFIFWVYVMAFGLPRP
ncbi:MAG: hypothetical protein NTX45_07525 [Proteobacteria bacterium]|nr:hypothetical protein [Pseudomonadota bacterium]